MTALDDRLRAAAEEYADRMQEHFEDDYTLSHDGFLAGAKYEKDRAEGLLEALKVYSTLDHIDNELERAVIDQDSSPLSYGRGERYVCAIAKQAIAAYRDLK